MASSKDRQRPDIDQFSTKHKAALDEMAGGFACRFSGINCLRAASFHFIAQLWKETPSPIEKSSTKHARNRYTGGISPLEYTHGFLFVDEGREESKQKE